MLGSTHELRVDLHTKTKLLENAITISTVLSFIVPGIREIEIAHVNFP